MDEIKLFEAKIFEGLARAHQNIVSFTDDESLDLKPEYLINVNIAQSLNELKKYQGFPYVIKLEEPTILFATNCVNFLSDSDCIFKIKTRSSHNSNRRGKVDIAIYGANTNYPDYIPIAVIEVKGGYKNLSHIKMDINRNLDFLYLEDENTGVSLLKRSYITFVIKEKRVLGNDLNESLTKIKEKIYTKLSIKNHFKGDNLKLRVEVQTVASNCDTTYEKTQLNDIEYLEDRYAKSYHCVGVLVVIEKP